MPLLTVELQLPFEMKKENGWYVSSCKILDVYSQGKTKAEAKRNLAEALFLFFMSCFERGTLDEVLKDCGFEVQQQAHAKKSIKKPHLDVRIPFGIREASNSNELCHA